jgi:hypothetical protein
MSDYFYRGEPFSIVNGHQCWFDENGEIHREDGPAFISAHGDKQWEIHGINHRLDGPAIEWASDRDRDGNLREQSWWFYKGERISCSSQKEFEKMLKMKAFW